MLTITPTVYGAYIQTCQYLGESIGIKPNTTLNEKHSIYEDLVIGQDEIPRMGYIAIGNGGHKFSIGANGISKTETIQHRPTDAALYNQIPFIIRTADSDLTPFEREKYAHRKELSINGVNYIAYYLKRVDLSDVTIQMDYKTITIDQVNGSVTTNVTTFTPTTSNLDPTPPDVNNTGVNTTTGDYVSSTAKIPLQLTENEIEELFNVSRVLYDGDDGYAIISEIALCTGVDRIVEIDNAGIVSNFKEAMFVQVSNFIGVCYLLKFTNAGIDTLLDVGSTQPLFTL